MMNRRQFLKATSGTILLAGCPGLQSAESSKPPFRILFSNDTTNILTCTSPWHRKGEPLRPGMLEATVDELAGTGVEVHLMQPGLGWVPFWKSKLYPVEEHCRWLKERFGIGPDDFCRHVLAGGDLVKEFVDRCRQRHQAPFISYRLNDGHHKEWAEATRGEKISGAACQGLSRFYCDHPEYRIGSDLKNWNLRVQNWAIPEVRDHKLGFIRELCETYDLDGIELDFLRQCSLFQVEKTSAAERCAIMTGFVRQVRELLDRTARKDQHRWLGVRIPCFLAAHDPLGIDVAAFASAGVEMFNLSPSYVSEQQTDVAAIKRLLPGASVYVEMTHTTRPGPKVSAKTGYDDFSFRRTTDEQFYTTAHLAYARGLEGVSVFNFVYYREHGTPLRGPFNEPPFHVFKHLADPAWLAQQPQHYFITRGWDSPAVPNRQMGNTKLRVVTKGEVTRFTLDMAPPAGGWKKAGRLRIESLKPIKASRIAAKINGSALNSTDDISEPYPNLYAPLLGTEETLRAWSVPASLLRDGTNEIELALESGEPVSLVFLDLAAS